MRGCVLVVMAAMGCRPAPVQLNPDKERARESASTVQRETAMTTAPGGIVTARDGSTLDLATTWAAAPGVVIFYRGHWCPHCQRQLGELEKRRPELGASKIIAISSDQPADLTAMHDKLGLGFELYSDSELGVITKWGVEDYGKGIARPATFIVTTTGTIAFQKVGERPEDRPTVDEIVQALANLQ